MQIKFQADSATWTANGNGSFLCIPAADPVNVLGQLDAGKEYVCEIKRKRERRSTDSNSYYWELVGKLSKVLNVPPNEIYHRHIADLGNYTVLGMPEDAVQDFERMWTSDHLGRFVETRAAKMDGIVNVLAYYGSSDFDTRQMSHLIDNCIQDCHALGIETRPQEEVDSLLAQWDEKRNQGDGYPSKSETQGI